MADHSNIEWTDATWNPITGCSVVSLGCTNCYAMRLAGTRLTHHPSRAGLTRDIKSGPIWTGEVRLNEAWLDQPLRWKRPRMIFVCAHGDLFHENVPDEWIDRVMTVAELAPQHTFQILTKRAARMRAYAHSRREGTPWPHPNIWLGVSAEDQQRADERIPHLLATPAAVRWISAEPLLGPMDLRPWLDPDFLTGCGDDDAAPPATLDWVVAGGESGPGARPMHPDWARSLRDQCASAGVPFFFKQWGDWAPTPARPKYEGVMLRPDGTAATTLLDAYGRNTEGLARVGKVRAGRLLDSREHNGMPGDVA